MLISAPLCFSCGGRTAQRVQAHWCAFAVAWHKDEGSDATLPGALYSEPGSEGIEGGKRREKTKWEKAVVREEESTETV